MNAYSSGISSPQSADPQAAGPYGAPQAPPPVELQGHPQLLLLLLCSLALAALIGLLIEAIWRANAPLDEEFWGVVFGGAFFIGLAGGLLGLVFEGYRGFLPAVAAGAVLGSLASPLILLGANLLLAAGLFGALLILAGVLRRCGLTTIS